MIILIWRKKDQRLICPKSNTLKTFAKWYFAKVFFKK